MSDKYKVLADHYEGCFDKYGDTHLGVDWPKQDDVYKRYSVMLDVIKFHEDKSEKVSLLDFGCGTAHLNEYILTNKYSNIGYAGLDISPKFVQASKAKFPDTSFFCVDILKNSDQLPRFDYIVMNGVFTEKREMTFEEMFSFFQSMLVKVFAHANKGIAFNTMSKAVDWEREDLFHLPTDLLINFLTKKLTRNFIIRNDYGLYEYTTYVYK
jgi:SAM-dependent methyltransferase